MSTWLALVTSLALTGCDGHSDHAAHSAHSTQGGAGAAALGPPLGSLPEVVRWVQQSTGECSDVRPATREDLAAYLGPQRFGWYESFVADWVTCSIRPYARLGLVVFGPGQQQALQRFWLDGVRAGRIPDNPDWAFGNGFAITAGPLGTERLGLRYLWCKPMDVPGTHTIPADVEGCVFAASHQHK